MDSVDVREYMIYVRVCVCVCVSWGVVSVVVKHADQSSHDMTHGHTGHR